MFELQFLLFPDTFLPVARKKNYIDTSNNLQQLVQYIVNQKNKIWFFYMIFVFRIFFNAKKSFSHLRTKPLSRGVISKFL